MTWWQLGSNLPFERERTSACFNLPIARFTGGARDFFGELHLPDRGLLGHHGEEHWFHAYTVSLEEVDLANCSRRPSVRTRQRPETGWHTHGGQECSSGKGEALPNRSVSSNSSKGGSH